jgi:hypothetical protein
MTACASIDTESASIAVRREWWKGVPECVNGNDQEAI